MGASVHGVGDGAWGVRGEWGNTRGDEQCTE